MASPRQLTKVLADFLFRIYLLTLVFKTPEIVYKQTA